MNISWLISVLFFIPIVAGAEVEEVRDLGFGFREETHAEPSASSFESVAHYGYLYYRGQKLARASGPECSISPSGRFAIYQDGASGKLFLFRRADRRITELTPKFVGGAKAFTWREASGEVHVEFYPAKRLVGTREIKPMTFGLK